MTAWRDDGRGPGTSGGERTKVRVNVWLWNTCQCKTRSPATSERKTGHVRANDETAEPSTPIRIGGEVRYRYEGFDRILKVTGVISKRISTPLTQVCHGNLTSERPRVRIPVMRRKPRTSRPTEKERHELDKLFSRDSNFGRLG